MRSAQSSFAATTESSRQSVAASAAARAVLERAAALAGMSVPDYVRGAVLERARRDVLATTKVRRRWRWRVPPTVRGPARVRALARTALAGCGLDGECEVCLVLLTELVTNAVRYGGAGPVAVRLVVHDDRVTAAVSDHNAAGPVPARKGSEDEGGRGLVLLARLSTSSGWYRTATGKTVWFTCSVRPPGPATTPGG
ncbi:ATP-binding protein [Actinomadura fulvescens]|uniref:Histidine kinase/HSP90-like ATPase domain-containing protein n=1 Tax=Actinomadura fulvescens TaxID=46160 RepID=A0ABN3QLF3_9ACTN